MIIRRVITKIKTLYPAKYSRGARRSPRDLCV